MQSELQVPVYVPCLTCNQRGHSVPCLYFPLPSTFASSILISYRVGFDYQAAVSVFGSSVGRTMEVLWSQASEEIDLQVCLNQMISQILIP